MNFEHSLHRKIKFSLLPEELKTFIDKCKSMDAPTFEDWVAMYSQVKFLLEYPNFFYAFLNMVRDMSNKNDMAYFHYDETQLLEVYFNFENVYKIEMTIKETHI